jgi:hypothetical protein
MRIITIITAVVAVSLLFLSLLTCEKTVDPYDRSQAKVALFLKSSNGLESRSSITDTVDNTDTVGLVVYLTEHFDSTELKITFGGIQEYYYVYRKKTKVVDTTYYPVSFSSAGEHVVTATG